MKDFNRIKKKVSAYKMILLALMIPALRRTASFIKRRKIIYFNILFANNTNMTKHSIWL